MSALRNKLLNLARGFNSCNSKTPKRVWKSFPLESKHVGERIADPSTFHSVLCNQVRKAQKRVHIATLYIGAGVDPIKYSKETEFLRALSDINENVNVRILLDHNRALRPVPIPSSDQTITSAEACRSNLSDKAEIYLLSVLDGTPLQYLPNPLNEIAGVFHVKLYIIDDEIFLSGANLSQEYFHDRHDRYLWLKKGANGLVDTYSNLIDTLCKHASHVYRSPEDSKRTTPLHHDNRETLFDNLIEVLTLDQNDARAPQDSNSVVSHAIATFQAPENYFARISHQKRIQMPTDAGTVHDILEGAYKDDKSHRVRLASAYLNPTPSFFKATRKTRLDCLTAGSLSHGFRPKRVTGNRSRTEWIPSVFDSLAAKFPPHARVWHYQRSDWTFHAKGIWLTYVKNVEPRQQDNLEISTDEDLILASHGSGNYGWRSEVRDMESNLILVFNQPNSFSRQLREEWNEMVHEHVVPRPLSCKDLPWHLSTALPWIKPYF